MDRIKSSPPRVSMQRRKSDSLHQADHLGMSVSPQPIHRDSAASRFGSPSRRVSSPQTGKRRPLIDFRSPYDNVESFDEQSLDGDDPSVEPADQPLATITQSPSGTPPELPKKKKRARSILRTKTLPKSFSLDNHLVDRRLESEALPTERQPGVFDFQHTGLRSPNEDHSATHSSCSSLFSSRRVSMATSNCSSTLPSSFETEADEDDGDTMISEQESEVSSSASETSSDSESDSDCGLEPAGGEDNTSTADCKESWKKSPIFNSLSKSSSLQDSNRRTASRGWHPAPPPRRTLQRSPSKGSGTLESSGSPQRGQHTRRGTQIRSGTLDGTQLPAAVSTPLGQPEGDSSLPRSQTVQSISNLRSRRSQAHLIRFTESGEIPLEEKLGFPRSSSDNALEEARQKFSTLSEVSKTRQIQWSRRPSSVVEASRKGSQPVQAGGKYHSSTLSGPFPVPPPLPSSRSSTPVSTNSGENSVQAGSLPRREDQLFQRMMNRSFVDEETAQTVDWDLLFHTIKRLPKKHWQFALESYVLLPLLTSTFLAQNLAKHSGWQALVFGLMQPLPDDQNPQSCTEGISFPYSVQTPSMSHRRPSLSGTFGSPQSTTSTPLSSARSLEPEFNDERLCTLLMSLLTVVHHNAVIRFSSARDVQKLMKETLDSLDRQLGWDEGSVMLARLSMFSLLQKLRHSEAPKLRRDQNSQTWDNLLALLRVLEELILRRPPRAPGIPANPNERAPISLHTLPEEELRLRQGYAAMGNLNSSLSASSGGAGSPASPEDTADNGCRATPLVKSVVQLLRDDIRVEQLSSEAEACDTVQSGTGSSQQPKREKEIRKAALQELQFWTALQSFCDQVVPNRAASTALHAARDRLRSMSGSSGSGGGSSTNGSGFGGTLGRRKSSRAVPQTLDSATTSAIDMFVKVLRRRSHKESSKKLRAQLLAVLEALHTRESSSLKKEAARFAEFRMYGSLPPPTPELTPSFAEHRLDNSAGSCCCHQQSPPPILQTPSLSRSGSRRNSSASVHPPGSTGGENDQGAFVRPPNRRNSHSQGLRPLPEDPNSSPILHRYSQASIDPARSRRPSVGVDSLTLRPPPPPGSANSRRRHSSSSMSLTPTSTPELRSQPSPGSCVSNDSQTSHSTPSAGPRNQPSRGSVYIPVDVTIKRTADKKEVLLVNLFLPRAETARDVQVDLPGDNQTLQVTVLIPKPQRSDGEAQLSRQTRCGVIRKTVRLPVPVLLDQELGAACYSVTPNCIQVTLISQPPASPQL